MSTPPDSTVQPARTPRGTLRRLRRAALRNEALIGPAHLVAAAEERKRVVLERGFLRREPNAAQFEQRAHRALHGEHAS